MPKRIYVMHFIVACLGVCLCDFAYVPGVDCVASPNPTGFYWVGVCLCDFTWCLSVWLHPPCVAFLVRVRIWLCGFAYPTTLRGEVNFPENHACGEPVTVVTPIVEVCIRIGDLFIYTRWWELLLSLRAFSCVCGNLLCVHLSHRLYIYILVFCGDPFLSFAGSSHPDVGLGRGDDGGCSGSQWEVGV